MGIDVKVLNGRVQVWPNGTNLAQRMEGLPGAYKTDRMQYYSFPATPAVSAAIVNAVGDLDGTLSDEFLALYGDSVQGAQALEYLSTHGEIPDHESKTRSWEHQKRFHEFALRQRASGLFADMGCGKSKSVVDLVVARDHRRVLIVAPNNATKVWPRQFRDHSAKDVDVHLTFGWTEAQRTELVQLITSLEYPRPQVVVVNYEAISSGGAGLLPNGMPKPPNWADKFRAAVLSCPWDLVVLDEAHRVKAPQGKTSKYFARLGDQAPFKLALTGTPMSLGPEDMFAVYRFLDKGVFGTSYRQFKNRYMVFGGYLGLEKQGYQNLDELAEKVASISYRVTKEVLDLPDQIFETRYFQLNTKARRAYRQMREDFCSEVESGRVSVNNTLTRQLRLQQICCGYLPFDPENRKRIEVLDDGREKLLQELVEDVGLDENGVPNPIVVFSRFHPDLDCVRAVAERLGLRYGEVSGRQNDLTADAEMPEGVDVLGVQIQAGGVGINLTRSHYCIFYSLNHSYGDYDQCLSRLHRPGQTETVFYYTLAAENTIDELIMRAIAAKESVAQYVHAHVQELREMEV